jgi:hypothetical protein
MQDAKIFQSVISPKVGMNHLPMDWVAGIRGIRTSIACQRSIVGGSGCRRAVSWRMDQTCLTCGDTPPSM